MAARVLAVLALAGASLAGTLVRGPESLARTAAPEAAAGGGTYARAVPAASRTAERAATRAGAPRRRLAIAPQLTPAYRIDTVVSGRTQLWDLAFAPDGSMLYDQRGGGLFVRRPDGTDRQLTADLGDLWVSGETGLMGIAVDPAFTLNRRIYTCQGWQSGTAKDIRVIAWVVDEGWTALTRAGAPVVTGIPVTTGRHGGCRLRFDATDALVIGTGDAAIGTAPQDMTSLAGKVLRIDAFTGAPAPDNPFHGDPDPRTRLIWTWGHRNVQGLALRPGTDEMWSAEHGPSRDDEVNKLTGGGNYGWDPDGSGGTYDESVPMTAAGALPARWSSGSPAVATSGAGWISGPRWGRWDGALAVATLAGQKLLVLTPGADGRIARAESILTGQYGRLRSVQLGPDGALYLSTANGTGDRILRLTPNRTGKPTPRYSDPRTRKPV